MSELNSINKALALYRFDNTSGYGSSSVIYLSLPDNNANCSTYTNLPTPPVGYTYSCKPESQFKNVNGTGWIPVNFNNITSGNPLSSLPTDPNNNNNDNNNLYFTYTVSGTDTWELTARLLSESKRDFALNSKDGGDDNDRYEIGANLATSPQLSYVYNLGGDISSNRILNLGISNIFAQSPTPAIGQVSVFNDSTHVYGTDNLFWDYTNSRLGINTGTSPAYPLDIVGTTNIYSTTDTLLRLSRQSATSTLFKLGTDSALILNNNNSDVLTIKNGNIGIGTTTPTQKLSVAGTIESTTGGFKFPNGTTQTSAGITTFTPINRTNVLSAGQAQSWTSVNLSSVVPVSAKIAYINWYTSGNNYSQVFFIGSNSAGTLGQARVYTVGNSVSYSPGGQAQIILTTPQTLYYLSGQTEDAKLFIEVYGYGM